jgi:hypothetical protein
MAVYNVVVSVLALVEAETEEAAVAKLRAKIAQRGLLAMDDAADGKYASAFESEPGTTAEF